MARLRIVRSLPLYTINRTPPPHAGNDTVRKDGLLLPCVRRTDETDVLGEIGRNGNTCILRSISPALLTGDFDGYPATVYFVYAKITREYPANVARRRITNNVNLREPTCGERSSAPYQQRVIDTDTRNTAIAFVENLLLLTVLYKSLICDIIYLFNISEPIEK